MMVKDKKTVRFVFTWLIVFTFSSLLFAQDSPDIDGKSCLWKVQSEKNTVYLLGSVHILKQENYPLKKSIEQAFDDVQKLVFEIHLDSAETLSVQMKILSKGMYSDGSTLQENIDEETYSLVTEKAEELGLGIEQMSRFKPWFVTVTLITLKLQKLGFDPNYGVDKYFFKKAKEAGKEIAGLETVEYQIDLFDSLSKMNQKDLILQTLKELDVLEEEIDDLIDAWRMGHSVKLEDMVLKSFKEYPEIYRKFIYERNISWLPQVESLLKINKNVLVIVGAGHLLGNDGIISLLEKRGYSAEQL